MITVVGVGIAKGDLTANGKKAIKNADRVFSRVKLWIKSENLGEKFSSVSSYGELDNLIAEEVIEASKSGQKVVYLALGDGYTDTAVIEIAKNSEVGIVAGVSEYRGKNPALDTRVISAGAVDDDTIFDTTVPLIVYGIDDKFVASNIKLALACYYGDETQVVFSNKSQTVKIPLYELDRQSRYDGGALFIDGADFLQKNKYCYRDLMEVMKRLTAPDGCPWDRAQTHESIRVNLIEEAYEVVDAIDNGDTDNLIEELGDYLLQVVFHCDMATRDGEFTLCEVIDALVKKLVSRHTHIFGENKATDAESALGFWEKAKAKEKSYTTLTEQIERLPNSFSPLMRAGKISKKAVKSGADIDAIKLTEKIENLVNGG
ncbi:MAG: MazG family protein, partial [Clostridia bacterium]|nr:MazG family protein [Clostridia bacterium]